MKVLQIIDSLATGGAEKLLLDSIPLYRKAGIDMDLLVLKDDNYPFMQQLEAQNICTIYKLGKGSVYNPVHVLKIAKIIKKYDLAHVHLFPAFYWVVLAKLISFSSVKIINTEHSTSNRRMRNKLLKWLDLFIYSKINKIITISDEVDSHLKKYLKFSNKRYLLIKNGINIKKIFDAKQLSKNELNVRINELNKIILQVSSFHYPKDQYTVIKSLLHLPNNIIAVFVGDGVDKFKFEKFVNQHNLTDRVYFLGIRTDIPQLLKTADIIVLSSHYEGMSLSSIEGMASGKPFVASDVPGLHEVVKGAGVLFPQGDDKTLAKIIQHLIDDQNYYNQVSLQCQERASQYDIKHMVNKYVKLYEQVLA